MIITINEKQEVIAVYDGAGVTPNSVTSFEVNTLPEREAGKALCFDPELGCFYSREREPVDVEARRAAQAKTAERRAAQAKKTAALKWLADNDWKVNKHLLGEWADNDPRWIEYLAGREQARKDYDEAEAILANA